MSLRPFVFRLGFVTLILYGGMAQAQGAMHHGEHQKDWLSAKTETTLRQATSFQTPRVDALNQTISAHYEGIALHDLLDRLAPLGWKVQFDMTQSEINPTLVFHAETTRRQALNQLLLRLGLKGIFYRHKKLILISNEA